MEPMQGAKTSLLIASIAARIALRGNREAGLNNIDTKLFKSMSHLRTFLGRFMLQPGDCSPSRKVVSRKITGRDAIGVCLSGVFSLKSQPH